MGNNCLRLMPSLTNIKWGLIAPALKEIGLYSDTALNLVTGTGLVESGYRVTAQTGGGPALGWFQMEPVTYQDCWDNYLKYRSELSSRILFLVSTHETQKATPDARILESNHPFSAAMCRVKYLRVPAPLPPNDAASLSLYHKKYYNTMLGKANATKNIPLFQAAIDA